MVVISVGVRLEHSTGITTTLNMRKDGIAVFVKPAEPVVAEDDDGLEYVTRVDVNMAIIREIAKLQFKERLPRIMAGVAKQLMDAGVDFSRVVVPENLTITDEEWDAIYEDLR